MKLSIRSSWLRLLGVPVGVALGTPLLIALGCDAGTEEPEEPEDPTRIALDPACEEKYDARAQALVTQYSSCEVDADCSIETLPGCVSPFLCFSSVASSTAAELTQAANQIVSDYMTECGAFFCINADCETPDSYRAICDLATHQCSAERKERTPATLGNAP